MAASIVQLHDIRKTYQMGLVTVEALRGVSIDIHAAEYVSIMGPSGCGKSTLLNLLGCLDHPSSGPLRLGSEDISQLDDNALSGVRGTRLGVHLPVLQPHPAIDSGGEYRGPTVLPGLAGGGEPRLGERGGFPRGSRRPP